jgi:hypothetical protein
MPFKSVATEFKIQKESRSVVGQTLLADEKQNQDVSAGYKLYPGPQILKNLESLINLQEISV